MMTPFHCYTPPPSSNTNDDIDQSPSQGGVTVEGDFEQLNVDPIRSDSLSVRQRADDVCQLLRRGLNSQWHVLDHRSRPSAMVGSSFGNFASTRVWNHRTHRSQMSSTSVRSIPFSSLMYAELLASLLSSSSSGVSRNRPDRLPERVF